MRGEGGGRRGVSLNLLLWRKGGKGGGGGSPFCSDNLLKARPVMFWVYQRLAALLWGGGVPGVPVFHKEGWRCVQEG